MFYPPHFSLKKFSLHVRDHQDEEKKLKKLEAPVRLIIDMT